MSQMIHEGLEYQRYTEPGRDAKPERPNPLDPEGDPLPAVEAAAPIPGFVRRPVGGEAHQAWEFIPADMAPIEVIRIEAVEKLRQTARYGRNVEIDPRVQGEVAELMAEAVRSSMPVRPKIIRADGTIEEG